MFKNFLHFFNSITFFIFKLTLIPLKIDIPFVKAAKERIKLGLEFTPGMKVAYVVTKTSGNTQEVEPWLVEDGGEPVSNYDIDYYSKRLAKALGRITEAFGWSENELLTGTRQTTLFSF